MRGAVKEITYFIHIPQQACILIQDFLLEIGDERVGGAEKGIFGCGVGVRWRVCRGRCSS